MNPHLFVKVGLKHGCDPRFAESWEVIGELCNAANERDDFMPFRLKKADSRFERVANCELVIERDQRFDRETSSATDADKPKPSKKSLK